MKVGVECYYNVMHLTLSEKYGQGILELLSPQPEESILI